MVGMASERICNCLSTHSFERALAGEVINALDFGACESRA